MGDRVQTEITDRDLPKWVIGLGRNPQEEALANRSGLRRCEPRFSLHYHRIPTQLDHTIDDEDHATKPSYARRVQDRRGTGTNHPPNQDSRGGMVIEWDVGCPTR